MVEMITRWAWTSIDGGDGLGTAYQMGNVPSDAVFIDAPPEPWVAWNNQARYWYQRTSDEWLLKSDAEPATIPSDFYAWDWSYRYLVDETDPLRNSWVLDPNAQPVEPPAMEEGGE